MFEWVRMRVGLWLDPSYWPVFEAHGWRDLGHKLNDMSKKGQWQEMTKEISDDVVHQFCRWGDTAKFETPCKLVLGPIYIATC